MGAASGGTEFLPMWNIFNHCLVARSVGAMAATGTPTRLNDAMYAVDV